MVGTLKDAMMAPSYSDGRYMLNANTRASVLCHATWFFSTLNALTQDLMSDKYNGYPEWTSYPKWLIALTDGEPTGMPAGLPQPPHPGTQGQSERQLKKYGARQNNLVIITVSADVQNDDQFKALTSTVQKWGTIGEYVSAKNTEDATAIEKAFVTVQEALVDISGNVEQA